MSIVYHSSEAGMADSAIVLDLDSDATFPLAPKTPVITPSLLAG